jgi:hypothetical protein
VNPYWYQNSMNFLDPESGSVCLSSVVYPDSLWIRIQDFVDPDPDRAIKLDPDWSQSGCTTLISTVPGSLKKRCYLLLNKSWHHPLFLCNEHTHRWCLLCEILFIQKNCLPSPILTESGVHLTLKIGPEWLLCRLNNKLSAMYTVQYIVTETVLKI